MSPSNLTRRSLLAGAAAAPLAALTAPSWATTATRPGAVAAPRLTPWDRQVLHQLRPQNALNHLHHLADVIGQRYAGTPQEKAAADYLAATLDGYGYDVELESIPLGTRRVGELKGNGLDQILCWGVGIAAGGRSAGTVTGSVVVATDVTGSNLPADLTGKIVVRYPTVAESATTLDHAPPRRSGHRREEGASRRRQVVRGQLPRRVAASRLPRPHHPRAARRPTRRIPIPLRRLRPRGRLTTPPDRRTSMDTLTESDVADLLDDLAQLLPFPTTLYTDMGADSWAPQLYFGPVDPSSDLAAHRAGIDADTVRPVWWIDLDGGTRTILLDEVTPDDVCNVAARIAQLYPEHRQ